jgi:hypothetical protein
MGPKPGIVDAALAERMAFSNGSAWPNRNGGLHPSVLEEMASTSPSVEHETVLVGELWLQEPGARLEPEMDVVARDPRRVQGDPANIAEYAAGAVAQFGRHFCPGGSLENESKE